MPAVDPVSISLLLDASGSMTKSADIVRDTAREFVKAVRPEDSLSMITFTADGVDHLEENSALRQRVLRLSAAHSSAAGSAA